MSRTEQEVREDLDRAWERVHALNAEMKQIKQKLQAEKRNAVRSRSRQAFELIKAGTELKAAAAQVGLRKESVSDHIYHRLYDMAWKEYETKNPDPRGPCPPERWLSSEFEEWRRRVSEDEFMEWWKKGWSWSHERMWQWNLELFPHAPLSRRRVRVDKDGRSIDRNKWSLSP